MLCGNCIRSCARGAVFNYFSKRDTTKYALTLKMNNIKNLTQRARQIITSSLTRGFPIKIHTIAALHGFPTKVRIILSVTNGKAMRKMNPEPNDISTLYERMLRSILQDNYGDGAADTWMEGNIELENGKELYLDFVSFKRLN